LIQIGGAEMLSLLLHAVGNVEIESLEGDLLITLI
jgi:hypothetical protein